MKRCEFYTLINFVFNFLRNKCAFFEIRAAMSNTVPDSGNLFHTFYHTMIFSKQSFKNKINPLGVIWNVRDFIILFSFCFLRNFTITNTNAFNQTFGKEVSILALIHV